jgi:hypothetical protein
MKQTHDCAVIHMMMTRPPVGAGSAGQGVQYRGGGPELVSPSALTVRPRARAWTRPPGRPAMAELDRGAVQAIFNGDTNCAPRVQVLDVKLIPPKPGAAAGSGRYRLVVSDGQHLMQATEHPWCHQRSTA